ncbi:MAG TPA: hypothetical protein VGS17_12860 [Candidatus Limnocylindria bacterium]|nr:hypothetical protein [Candidatus Limnocylindria bacterium]
MSRPRAPHPAARAFADLADGVIVLVAGVTALAAGLMVAGVIGTGAAEGRLPPTSALSASASVAAISPAPTPSATPLATPLPSLEPMPAISVSPYRFGGRSYAGIEVRPGTVFRTPLEGTVEVRLYQYINNDVRIGSNVPSLPFFPYVTVVSSDRRLTFRPGALSADTELLVRDAQRVGVGAPLFRAIGPGLSSWATFYDPTITFQVVASLNMLPSGRELDPLIGYLAD